MKVAVLGESEADEAAIRVLVDAALGIATAPPSMPSIRSRGWASVLTVLPAILRHVHYRTDAVGLVVVLDSDRSPVHAADHEQPGADDPKCRLCVMKKAVERVQNALGPRPGAPPLKTALGLATPQVEAWYLAGLDPHVSEAAWVSGVAAKKPPYTSDSLKRQV